MGLREEYFWLKGILESEQNRPHHRPALLRLIQLYEDRWTDRPKADPIIVAISVNRLKKMLKQD
jgi:hypothetical protein